jgi:hypothetical protein
MAMVQQNIHKETNHSRRRRRRRRRRRSRGP